LKFILFPIQQYLGIACKFLRCARNIILWVEPYYAFWITTACLLLSFLCFFVPWFWLIKWTSRVVVWTLLGPWMKLVDVFYFVDELSNEERIEKNREKKLGLQSQVFGAYLKQARISREKAVKLRAIKGYLYGKHIKRIPMFKTDRYADVPLPESMSRRIIGKNMAARLMEQEEEDRVKIQGQHVVWNIIPIRPKENQNEAVAEQDKRVELNLGVYVKFGIVAFLLTSHKLVHNLTYYVAWR